MKPRYTKKQIAEAIAYWERQLKAGNYRKVDESADAVSSITIPSDADKIDMARFQDEIDTAFSGDMYEYFVPDRKDEMEGARRDIDSWEIYKVNRQNTISRTRFWDLAFEDLFDVYEPGQKVDTAELKDFFETACSKIAEDAWNEYRPGENDLLIY